MSYAGACIPAVRESAATNHSVYQDYSADFDLSDFDDDPTDYRGNPSNSADMSEWFDPDIAAYFATSEHVTPDTPSEQSYHPNSENFTSKYNAAECAPVSKTSQSKSGCVTFEHSIEEYTPNRKSHQPNRGKKKQSIVSQMRELSQKLEQEQSGTQPVTKTIERLPMKPTFGGRKRLIDKMFDELLEPKKPQLTENTRVTSVATVPTRPSVKSTPQVYSNPKPAEKPWEEYHPMATEPLQPSIESAQQVLVTNPQPAKKPRLQDSTASTIARDTSSTHFSLSKKLSTQMHSHTDECRPSLSNKTDTDVTSLYDTEPNTQHKPAAATSSTSFFTAGPVR